ncbi:hypothetical protein D3C87_1780840 [compost metagenome]
MEPQADPLESWLSSQEKLRTHVPANALVLPAHDDPFRGLHTRLDRLSQKRKQALERLRRALLKAPHRAIDCFQTLFARAQLSQIFVTQLATGEAMAYLNHLQQQGEARLAEDADGIAWFSSPA